MHSEASLAASVPALVNYAIACGLVDEGSRARLLQLWGIWLKGVGWAKCTMSHTNRRGPCWDCIIPGAEDTSAHV